MAIAHVRVQLHKLVHQVLAYCTTLYHNVRAGLKGMLSTISTGPQPNEGRSIGGCRGILHGFATSEARALAEVLVKMDQTRYKDALHFIEGLAEIFTEAYVKNMCFLD